MVKIMAGRNVTTVSVSPPFLKQKVFLVRVAPIHRKAKILTRDPLREVEDDSMELQVEDDVRRLAIMRTNTPGMPIRNSIFCNLLSISASPGSRDTPGRV